jgi:hypothetical protein
MAVTATGIEKNGSVAKPSGLALDSRELLTIINDEVVARVLAKGDEHRVSDFA